MEFVLPKLLTKLYHPTLNASTGLMDAARRAGMIPAMAAGSQNPRYRDSNRNGPHLEEHSPRITCTRAHVPVYDIWSVVT